jgi:hypothetical protein
MSSTYFSVPSFARAKQNQEQLEKSNPQNPVLKDEDEKFLEKQISRGQAAPAAVKDDGEEAEQAGADAEQVAVPETKPDDTEDKTGEANVEDPPEELPDDSTDKADPAAAKSRKGKKKDTGFDLPSQEDAEAATRGWGVGSDKAKTSDEMQNQQQGEKRTWASYLPSLGTTAKKDYAEGSSKPVAEKAKKDDDEAAGADEDLSSSRTWSQYASETYTSLATSLNTRTSRKGKDKDSKAEPVYNEDGTINGEKTKEKQEREVSVLLDQLNMSAINNRVFAFNEETKKIYERFAQVLRDTMDGAPTAYEDMEKLMKDAGPTLEKQFQSMPPFVQTLVKSLPAKLGTTLGPELLAAASEKPGADAKKMAAASAAGGSANASTSGGGAGGAQAGQKGQQQQQGKKKKKKKKIPGLKGLVSEQGAVAGILRNVVNFLRVRFPFLASTTNVVMSLAVFSTYHSHTFG